MFIKRELIRYILFILVVILTLTCLLAVQKETKSCSIGYEVPIYKIPISESTQRDIWKPPYWLSSHRQKQNLLNH